MNLLNNEFEKIYNENYGRVYSFLYKMCRSRETAEDLTQETFYQAYKSLWRYNGTCQMFTWLAAIAKNLFLNHLRKSKKDSMLIDLYVTEPEAPECDAPEYRLMKKVEISELRRAISSMPKKYSEVLILRTYGELPYSEISSKLGISENSAKVIFYRAKKMLEEALIND